MRVSNWLGNYRRWLSDSPRRSVCRPIRRRLAFDRLEDRIAPDAKTFAGLEFLATNSFTNNGTQASVTGPVQVGLAPANNASFIPLLNLDAGAQFDSSDASGNFTTSGSAEAVIGGLSIPLLDNHAHTISGKALATAAGFTLPATDSNATQVSVAGVQFALTNIAITGSAIDLQGSITVPGLAGLTLSVTGTNHVVIDTNGVHLSGIDASITTPETIGIAGLSLTVKSLAVKYASAGNTFQISGAGALSLLGQNVNVTLGTATQPGLVIQNGTVTSFNFALATKAIISFAGMTLAPQSLSASYRQSTSTLVISGSAGLSVGSVIKNATLALGANSTPGLVIRNGTVTSFDGGITASAITVAGVGFTNVSLQVDYQAAAKDLAISGGATFTIPGTSNNVTVALGDANTPGIEIQNGSLAQLNFSIAADSNFTLGGLSIDPKSLAVSYVQSTQTFTLDGEATFSVGSVIQNVDIKLGDGTNHGIVVTGGTLTSLQASVTGDIHVAGATISAKDLTLTYSSNAFAIYGSATFTFASQTLSADLGDAAHPGVAIKSGKLQSLHIGVDGSFNLFGFTVTANQLTVRYDASQHQLEFSGGVGVSLSSVISGNVTLSRGGLIIDTQTGALSIDATNGLDLHGQIALGGFSAVVDISYSDTAGQLNLSVSANVMFPGGIGIAASFAIVNNQLSSISFAYDDSTPGIPLGDSGLFITKVSGELDHLDNPSNITFAGSVTIVAGDTITIAGKQLNVLSMTGTVTVSPHEFDLNGTLTMVGGYLGVSAAAELSLNWTTGVYEISGTESWLDGVFSISDTLILLNNGDITLMGNASINVPDGLPGAVYDLLQVHAGESLASLNYYLQVRPHQALANTYGVAWLDIAGNDVGVKVALGGNPFSISGFVKLPILQVLENGYHAVVNAAATAWHVLGDTADQVAGAVETGFHVAGQDAAVAMRAAGYGVAKVGQALSDVYTLADADAAKALKAAGYAAEDVARVLVNVYHDVASDVAKAMATAGYLLRDVVSALHSALHQAADAVVAAVTSVFHTTVSALTTALHDAGYFAEDTAAAVGNAVTVAAADMAGYLRHAGYELNAVANVLHNVYGQAVADAGKVLSTLEQDATKVAAALNTVYHVLDVDMPMLLQQVGYGATRIAAAMQGVYQMAASRVTAFLQSLGSSAHDVAAAVQKVYKSVAADVSQFLSEAGYELSDVASALHSVFKQTAQNIASIFQAAGTRINDIAAALKTGIGLAANDALSTLQAAGMQAALALKDPLQKLEALAGLGGKLASMLMNVYSQTADDVARSFRSVLHVADTVVAQALANAGQDVVTVVTALARGYNDVAGRVATVLKGIPAFTTQEVASALGWLYNLSDSAVGAVMHAAGWGASELKSLGDDFVSAFDSAGDWFESVF
jgi:hypothetical protein